MRRAQAWIGVAGAVVGTLSLEGAMRLGAPTVSTLMLPAAAALATVVLASRRSPDGLGVRVGALLGLGVALTGYALSGALWSASGLLREVGDAAQVDASSLAWPTAAAAYVTRATRRLTEAVAVLSAGGALLGAAGAWVASPSRRRRPRMSITPTWTLLALVVSAAVTQLVPLLGSLSQAASRVGPATTSHADTPAAMAATLALFPLSGAMALLSGSLWALAGDLGPRLTAADLGTRWGARGLGGLVATTASLSLALAATQATMPGQRALLSLGAGVALAAVGRALVLARGPAPAPDPTDAPTSALIGAVVGPALLLLTSGATLVGTLGIGVEHLSTRSRDVADFGSLQLVTLGAWGALAIGVILAHELAVTSGALIQRWARSRLPAAPSPR